MGNLILLAGPNGSGKTTYYEQVLKEKYPDYFYINADAIKKDIEYYRALDLTKYGIEESQEVFDSYIKNNYTPNFTLYGGLYVVSKEQFNTYWWIEDYFIMVITTFILEKLVEQGANIIYETVFSHESKVDLIKSIK